MEISFLQIILIFLYLVFTYLESAGPETLQQFTGKTLLAAVVVGLILGDVKLGMSIGATVQLMALGLAHYGGAAIPDYPTGAAVGVMVAYMSGATLEVALPVAIAVAMLGSQIETLMTTLMIIFSQRSKRAMEKGDFKGAYKWPVIGLFCSAIMRFVPVLLLFFFGSDVISNLISSVPDYLMGTFRVMAGMMPALGMAVLLRYMNVKKYYPYLILGFAMVAIQNMSILSVAIFGFAIAAIIYINSSKFNNANNNEGALEDEI